MLIMTQGKSIVNFDNIVEVFAWPDASASRKGYYVFARGQNEEKIKLGWYGSEEKAEKVLLEIAEKYEVDTGKRTYKMP